MKRVHILVKGLVQGVGFRAFVRRNAKRLGIKGFVRNLPDGFTVEIVAEGPDDAIEQLISITKQGGPPGGPWLRMLRWSMRSPGMSLAILRYFINVLN